MSSYTNEHELKLESEPYNRKRRDLGATATIAASSTVAAVGCSLASGPLAPILGPICGVLGAIVGAVIYAMANDEFRSKPDTPQTNVEEVKVDAEPLRFSRYIYQVKISFPNGIIFCENIPMGVGDIFIYTLRGVGVVDSSNNPPIRAFLVGGPYSTMKFLHASGENIAELGEPAIEFGLVNAKREPAYLQQDNVSIASSGCVGYSPVCMVDWVVIKHGHYSEYVEGKLLAMKSKCDCSSKLNIEAVYLGPNKEGTSFTFGHSVT